MPVKAQGFSLLETLIAMSISSVLLLGAARMLPALHLGVMQQTQQVTLQEDLWQLAFTLGKHLQRAGYCNGVCTGAALTVSPDGQCMIVQWDENSNGRFEAASADKAEQTGYRLSEQSLETQRGATRCAGKGWEKLTDPQKVRVDLFSVQRQNRSGLPPLLTIRLAVTPLRYGGAPVSVEHTVAGYNL